MKSFEFHEAEKCTTPYFIMEYIKGASEWRSKEKFLFKKFEESKSAQLKKFLCTRNLHLAASPSPFSRVIHPSISVPATENAISSLLPARVGSQN